MSLKFVIKHELNDQIIDLQTVNSGCIVCTRSIFFRFFNRRGGWQDIYTVFLPLHNLVHHQSIPNTFLTREKQTNNLVLIKFNPFAVRRIPLNFRADFWLPSLWGFLCASQSGNIALLDLQCRYLGEINIHKIIKAIAPLNQDKIIVITENHGQQKKEIYTIKL